MNQGATSDRRSAEAAARACLTRFGSKRLLLSRVFEAIIRPFVVLNGEVRSDLEKEPQSILVLEYWYLGDLVMLTPFLRNLRFHYPRAHIAILASPKVTAVLEGQGLVDEVITVNTPWTQHLSRWKKYISVHWVEFIRCILALRSRRFDWGFCGRADIRENFILWVAGVRRRVGYGFGYGGSLLTDVVIPDLTRPHYSDRWLHLIDYIGKPVIDNRSALKVTPEQKLTAQRFLEHLGIRQRDLLIGIHAGARNRVRQWGEQNFLDVAERLAACFPAKILWFHEPGSTDPARSPWLVPVALPLREFLAVVSECRLFICNDTGPMHLASALGIPIVAIFGPGMSAWWGPRSVGSRVIANEGIWCRPCFDYCLFNEPHCLRTVSVQSVFEASALALNDLLLNGQPVAVSSPKF